MDTNAPNNQKRLAAESAVAMIKDGMIVGLGSGSTAEVAIQLIGERVKHGLTIIGVPTSHKSEALAKSLGIHLSTLALNPDLDLTIDGADEVEIGSLDLIKGLGGALLDEKIVASSSHELIIMVDETKLVNQLGARGKVPVEIVPFGWQTTVRRLQQRGWKPVLRQDAAAAPYLTDGGHHIVDCSFPANTSLQSKAAELHNTVGVVEHGIFSGMATQVHVGTPAGVRILKR